jgi:hypothetical protein
MIEQLVWWGNALKTAREAEVKVRLVNELEGAAE